MPEPRCLALFVPESGLACTECRLRHTVIRETWEEPFERPLPNPVVDFCSPLFLKNCVAVYSQDVVDAADSHDLSEEGNFRLRVLAELDASVHCSTDVSFAQELVREVLSRSDSESSVKLPAVTVVCTSPIIHSEGAASRSFTK